MDISSPALTLRPDLQSVTPARHRVAAGTAMLRETYGQIGKCDSQVYFGELFDVYETAGNVAYGRNVIDGYCGYLDAASLQPAGATPTHRVKARGAYLYDKPSVRGVIAQTLPMGAYVTASGQLDNGYLQVDGGYVWATALRPADQHDTDFVAVAERLLGTPYLWGGRTSDGIDCSGLVQLSLSLCGTDVPRDTDVQEAFFVAKKTDPQNLQRGDIVYFPGHVGIMLDSAMMLHANGHSMNVAHETLADFLARTKLPLTSAIRLG